MATKAPMMIIQTGRLEGKLNANRIPVRMAEPSVMVEVSLLRMNLVMAHSKNTQAHTDASVTITEPKPKA